MQKKHLLIVINSLSQGGAERVVSILLERFNQEMDFHIELVLLENEIAYELPSTVDVTILSKLNNVDSGMKKTLFIPNLAWKLHRHIKLAKPDLVVSFLYRADFVNVLASFFHTIPTIVSERVNASSTYNNSSLNAIINKFLIKTLYPKANMIVNVSEGTKDDLVENFGIKEKKQVVIYNPYDIKKITQLSQADCTLSSAKKDTIVVVSRFRPIKNIAMILRAFSRGEDCHHLVLVGDGSDEEMLHRLVYELNIEDRVTFIGASDNPYKYMANAALYISASRSEGFPNAMVEAMICGCAIISTDCPSGPREILAKEQHHDNQLQSGYEKTEFGILVAVDDEDALVEAMQEMWLDDTMQAYGRKAKERSFDFQLENIFNEYKDTFVRCIEVGRG